MTFEDLKRFSLQFLIAASLLILFLAVISYFHSRSDFVKAEELYRQQKFKEAASFYADSIDTSVPLFSPNNRSIERLWEIAQTFEQQKNFGAAYGIYESLKASIYPRRGLSNFYKEWYKKADARARAIWRMEGF